MLFDGTEYTNCKDEQEFKMLYIDRVLKRIPNKEIFCIETEETVHGFPDVMMIDKSTNQAEFFEFKYARNFVIKFQPSQPAFVRKHKYMRIKVVALDVRKKNVVVFPASDIFDKSSMYPIDEKGEVYL